MLIIYKLQIDTERRELHDELSIGFQDGVYQFSTAPLEGHYDCLDGNSFSEISQQNMILKGGELSLMEDVKIKIMSRKILMRISEHEIELLGCKATMSAILGDVEKNIFEGMLISSYSQLDEISFELILKDATFAAVGQINLSVPQGFDGGNQLETSYGKKCLLKLYKQNRSGESISQGVKLGREVKYSPELEQDRNAHEILTRLDDKPSFVKNFTASKVETSGGRTVVRTDIPEFSGTTGSYIELVLGEGVGEQHQIINQSGDSITLDRNVSITPNSHRTSLYRMGSYDFRASSIERPGDTWAPNFFPPPVDEAVIYTNNASILRFTGWQYRCAVPRISKHINYFNVTGNTEGPNAKVTNDDGSLSDVNVVWSSVASEKRDGCLVMELPGGANGKVNITEMSHYQPRWRVNYDPVSFSYVPGMHDVNEEDSWWTMNIKDNEPVGSDISPNWIAENLPVVQFFVPEAHHYYNMDVSAKMEVALYWRVDDLCLDGEYKIKPKFSFKTSDGADYPGPTSDRYITSCGFRAQALLVDEAGHIIDKKVSTWQHSSGNHEISLTRGGEIAEALGLTLSAKMPAKYIFVQINFEYSDNNYPRIAKWGSLKFAASPAVCERAVSNDKLLMIGRDERELNRPSYSVAGLAKRLCLDLSVKVDEQSFDNADSEMPKNTDPFIPIKQGDKIADKLAEICRAANISMFSNGSKLNAKHISHKELELTIEPINVMRGSLEVRSLGSDSIATEWNFAANTWSGQKTLSLIFSQDNSFVPPIWPSAGQPFTAEVIYQGYMERSVPGFGIKVTSQENAGKLRVGGYYRVNVLGGRFTAECELVSLRINNAGADALLIVINLILSSTAPQKGDKLEVTSLVQEAYWREKISGTLDIKFSDAEFLWDISQVAFKKIKRRNSLDERYSKHQVTAFGDDKSWLLNFTNTVSHNSFAKNIISFKVPIDHLPEGNLSSLMLRRIVLKFGRFKNNTLKGWIVGYTLTPAENFVRIEVMNSEPIKDFLWLNENDLEDQLTVDEREHSEEFYSER